jgi:hypothetical protein
MAPNAHVSASQWAALNGNEDPANKTRFVQLLTATVPLRFPTDPAVST